MQEPEPDPQDVSAQMRQRKIRDRLYQMDEASRLNLYLKANESDLELIQAVENAPESFPVVPAERVQEQKAIRIARKFPKQTAKLRDYRLYAQLLQQAAEFGKRQLSR